VEFRATCLKFSPGRRIFHTHPARELSPTTTYNPKSLNRRIYDALCRIPEDELTEDERRQKDELATLPDINIMQLIYRQKPYEGDAKDHEFSRLSMKDHWRAGYHDARATLHHKDWFEMTEGGNGICSHDIHRVYD
jgi:NTE family protein